MKIRIIPETLTESAALLFNLAPLPLIHTQIAFTVARAIMAGSELGVFDALGQESLTSAEVAARCQTDPRATRKLLDVLVSIGYLGHTGGRYRLARSVKKWLLRSSQTSVADKLAFQRKEWDLLAGLEGYVRSGQALDLHPMFGEADWASYHDAMRALSVGVAPEVGRRTPVPRGARTMLEIGGSHGLHSMAICRRHPQLSAVILDLPPTIERARALVTREGTAERIEHRPGNALEDDLGEDAYDVVYASNVVHHFTHEDNLVLARKVFRALRPGGVYVINEMERSERPGAGGVLGAVTDLYFGLISASGTWTPAEMAAWQSHAGLAPRRALRLRSLPGYVSQVGEKRRELAARPLPS